MRTFTAVTAAVLTLLAGGAAAAPAQAAPRTGSVSMCRVAAVPDVIGLEQRAAEMRLRWAGFRNLRVSVQKGGVAATYGPVWGTRPAPGTRANRCGEVVIVFAGGG